jgi:hypothetical protein
MTMRVISRLPYILIGALLLIGCRSHDISWPDQTLASTRAPVPSSVRRLAVILPKTYDRTFVQAYRRLEAGTFQLKTERPFLTILDRSDVSAIYGEQVFQLNGGVEEVSAVHAGKLLGADTVLVFHVDGPLLKDLIVARMHGALPPVLIVSKMIDVESGQVVYFNLVIVEIPIDPQLTLFTDRRLIQVALNDGVIQTLTDLHGAFR